MQFIIDKGYGNFADHLNTSNSKICKAAAAEWSQWQQYKKKHAGRLLNIQAGLRLTPVIAGHDGFDVNPQLLMCKDVRK